jgi:hypothetical protein
VWYFGSVFSTAEDIYTETPKTCGNNPETIKKFDLHTFLYGDDVRFEISFKIWSRAFLYKKSKKNSLIYYTKNVFGLSKPKFGL